MYLGKKFNKIIFYFYSLIYILSEKIHPKKKKTKKNPKKNTKQKKTQKTPLNKKIFKNR